VNRRIVKKLDGAAKAPIMLPEQTILLDFDICADQPGAWNQWEAGRAWVGFVRTPREALAAVAVELAPDDVRERVQLIAKRFRALLSREAASGLEARRLDLAAPLPKTGPWPPAYAGDPASREHICILTQLLNWHDVNAVAAWARAFAYYTAPIVDVTAPHHVREAARQHVRQLLDAAMQGLDVGRARPPAETAAKGRHAAKKGGAT
jgi:hypothetical protein